MGLLNQSPVLFRSSGDLIADRRFTYACDYAAGGDFMAAAELFEQAIARAPSWTAAWFALGAACEEAGSGEAALRAFARVTELDPNDEFGASLRLARLGAATPAAAPCAYVKALFDQYAERFDKHLVDELAYRAPGLLAQTLAGLGRDDFARCIDLGCGTGLCGSAFRDRVGYLTGVDLSPAAIEAARAKEIYDRLVVEDLNDFLSAEPEASVDLLLAADALVYIGDLSTVFAQARRALKLDGRFALTLQSGESGFAVGPDLRFAHAPDYVRELADSSNLAVAGLTQAALRREAGRDVLGLVVVLKPR